MATEYDRELRPEDHALARAEAAEQRVAVLRGALLQISLMTGDPERLRDAARRALTRDESKGERPSHGESRDA